MPIETTGICPLLQVFDMPTSIQFYRDVLEFQLVSHAPLRGPDEFGWCLLKNSDGSELMLNTSYDYGERPPEPDAARVSAHGDTCLYFGCPDVDAAHLHLLDKGLSIPPPKVAWYGMKQLYFTDPDGYGICFQWRA
jgi:glyoxylase I family protein